MSKNKVLKHQRKSNHCYSGDLFYCYILFLYLFFYHCWYALPICALLYLHWFGVICPRRVISLCKIINCRSQLWEASYYLCQKIVFFLFVFWSHLLGGVLAVSELFESLSLCFSRSAMSWQDMQPPAWGCSWVDMEHRGSRRPEGWTEWEKWKEHGKSSRLGGR